MGLNFRKSITILPGVRLNLSKGGVSASFGKKGLRQTISSTGRATTSIGIPGTGVYYTKSASMKKVAGKIQDKFTGKGKDKDKKEAVPAAAAAAATAAAPVAAEDLEENKAQVAEYEAYVDSLKSVHKQSDGQIDWEVLNKGEVPTNIVKGSEEYKEWISLQEFSQRVMDGDIDSYFEIIDEVKPFDDLLEFGSNFQVGTDRADHLEVEFAVKSEEIIPVKTLSLTATGKLSEKDIGKTAYYDLMQDYVCSTVIRVARDAFALLPVDTVIVHAVDKVLNTATGYEEELTLVSVKFDRAKLMSLNMSMIDPSDAIGGFENHMKFKKTAGFDPVERISI